MSSVELCVKKTVERAKINKVPVEAREQHCTYHRRPIYWAASYQDARSKRMPKMTKPLASTTRRTFVWTRRFATGTCLLIKPDGAPFRTRICIPTSAAASAAAAAEM